MYGPCGYTYTCTLSMSTMYQYTCKNMLATHSFHRAYLSEVARFFCSHRIAFSLASVPWGAGCGGPILRRGKLLGERARATKGEAGPHLSIATWILIRSRSQRLNKQTTTTTTNNHDTNNAHNDDKHLVSTTPAHAASMPARAIPQGSAPPASRVGWGILL